jgi:hypothetical protein
MFTKNQLLTKRSSRVASTAICCRFRVITLFTFGKVTIMTTGTAACNACVIHARPTKAGSVFMALITTLRTRQVV